MIRSSDMIITVGLTIDCDRHMGAQDPAGPDDRPKPRKGDAGRPCKCGSPD